MQENIVGGAFEPVLNAVSGMGAQVAGNVAGLAAMPLHAAGVIDKTPSEIQSNIQQEGTYQPQTTAGKVISKYNPLALLGKGTDWLGSKVEQGINAIPLPQGAKPYQEAVGRGVHEAINQAPALLGAKSGDASAVRLSSKLDELAKSKKWGAPKDAMREKLQAQDHITPAEFGVKAQMYSLGDKTKTDSAVARVNNEVATKNFADEVGLPNDVPLTENVLKQALQETYAARENMVAAVGPDLPKTPTFTKSLTELRDTIREDMQRDPSLYKYLGDTMKSLNAKLKEPPGGFMIQDGKRIPNPDNTTLPTQGTLKDISILREQAAENIAAGKNDLGFKQKQIADSLENLFQSALGPEGSPLYEQFKQNRVLQSKLYFIRETTDAHGIVNLADVRTVGNKPEYATKLTGALKDARDLANAWRTVAKNTTGMSESTFGPRDVLLGTLAAGHAIVNPGLAMKTVGTVAPFLGARHLAPWMAAKGYLQNGTPSYSVSGLSQSMPNALRGSGMAATTDAEQRKLGMLYH